jgi:arsenate reductase
VKRILFVCVENSNRSQMAEAFARILPDIEFDFATMGCGDACPFVRAKRREDWDIPDPKALPPEEFRAVRDLIGSKVKTLLGTLD